MDKEAFKPKAAAAKSESEWVRKIRQAYKRNGKIAAAKELFDQLKSVQDAFAKDGVTAEEMAEVARELKMIARAINLPPEIMEKLNRLAEKMGSKGKGGSEKKYEVPPPELDFTMEELLELLKRLEEQDFIDEALQQVDETRQSLIEKLKLCPYCKKGLKHPWEGGTPLPGMGPDGEPGVGYI
jgi:DNA repair ATPase RecN